MADRARGWPIAREGLPFLALAGVPAVAAWVLGWTAAGSLFGAVVLFTGWFFRNPPRRVPDGANLVVSPGDGRGLAVAAAEEPRFLKARAVRVSIFLSPLDVHINRTPCAGLVKAVAYSPGRFRWRAGQRRRWRTSKWRRCSRRTPDIACCACRWLGTWRGASSAGSRKASGSHGASGTG